MCRGDEAEASVVGHQRDAATCSRHGLRHLGVRDLDGRFIAETGGVEGPVQERPGPQVRREQDELAEARSATDTRERRAHGSSART